MLFSPSRHKTLLPNTITLVIKFQHRNFGRKHSVNSIEPTPSEGRRDLSVMFGMMSGLPEVFLTAIADV